MVASDEDVIFGTLMAYREAANQGDAGISAVLYVARNNAIKKNISFYEEVAATKFRYSSINCPVSVSDYVRRNNEIGLQQIINALSNYPQEGTENWTVWNHIKSIVVGVLSGAIQDITNGATLYYSTALMKSCPFNLSKIVFTTQIGQQRFYREL